MYSFFTYTLSEHKEFNGHPVRARANLQRHRRSAACDLDLDLDFLAVLGLLLYSTVKYYQVRAYRI